MQSWHPPTYISWECLRRPLVVCQTRSLLIKPKLLDMFIRLFHRKTRDVFDLPSVQDLGGGSLPTTVSLFYSRMGPRNASLGLQSNASMGILWMAATKPGATSHKNQAPYVHGSFLPRDIGALECDRGRTWREHPPPFGPRAYPSGSWMGVKLGTCTSS